MKTTILITYLFFFVPIGFPQSNLEYLQSILKSSTTDNIEFLFNGIVQIKNSNGRIVKKIIEDFENYVDGNPIDSTIIDMQTIDTSLYHHKYRFWQDVTVGQSSFTTILVDDINENSFPELYGYFRDYNTSNSEVILRAFELSASSNEFEMTYTYPDTILKAKDIFDVNGDDQKQLFAANRFGGAWGVLYKKNHPDSLATVEESNYFGGTSMRDFTFGDFNNDSITDFLYYTLAGFDTINGGGSTVIGSYNTTTNRLDSLVSFCVSDTWGAGYSISDVDGDDYPEIVLGTLHGDVRVIEYQPDTGYEYIWNGKVETFNAYVHFSTEDIDGNGKPEFWVGGDAFFGGIPITRYTCFESTANNEYTAVARIDLVGVFSSHASNAFAIDIDNDGTEELGLCVDQHFLILKFSGSPNSHSYEIYYIKKNELDLMGLRSDYFGVTMYDLLNDGTSEILISMRHVVGPPNYERREFTQIYTPDDFVSVMDEPDITTSYILHQNYPNPFNKSTKINFYLGESQFTTIVIHNILGEKLTTLVEGNLFSGKHSISWSGYDNNGLELPSGIYLISLRAGDYQQSIKTILMK